MLGRWQSDCAQVCILAFGVAALPTVELEAKRLVAVLGGKVCHCCRMHCILRIFEVGLDDPLSVFVFAIFAVAFAMPLPL